MATKNYTYGQYEDYEKISGEYLAEKYNIVNKGCLTCPIKCARTVKVNEKAVGLGLGYAVSNRGGCHLNGGYLVILEGLGLFINPTTYHGKADLTMLFQEVPLDKLKKVYYHARGWDENGLPTKKLSDSCHYDERRR